MKFSDIYGHSEAKNVLKSAADSGRIGHAYIFEGISGVGRLSCARAFAARLVCENPSGGDSCGVCKSCAMSAAGSHPDIRIITNQLYDDTKKSTDILVDTVRQMKNEIYIKPYMAKRKVYIVPKADTMNLHAQNSLLKVLEEPPAYCTIILIAENANLFLPTVLSRCVRVKFFALDANTVADYLTSHVDGMSADEAAIKAAMCGGSIGRALALSNDETALFIKRSKTDIDFIMDIMQSFFRDLMNICSAGTDARIVNTDKRRELDALAAKIYTETPLCLLEIMIKYRDCLDKNISLAAVAQCMSMEIWEAIHDRSYRCKI